MATPKQIADAEAERVEAEADDDDDTEQDTDVEPEGDDDTDPDAEPEPEPEQPIPTEAALERAVREVERAGDSYVEHVQAIQHEAELGLVECPLCPVPGFVPEMPMLDIPPDQRMAVLTVMGEGLGVTAPDHPTLHRCQGCDGWGLLTTGSRRTEFQTSPCPRCGGNGYMDDALLQAQADARLSSGLPPDADQLPPAPAQNHAVPTPTVTQGGHTFPVVLGGALDQFGRMAGHPLWGQPIEAGGL